ncbi:MAG TPA: HAMP domain-containing sensor histidine kinase, partial [Phnomibacter sp.]|nr:HAMP domain-containing sensor histidine kinase [Phnomibacter sp.]
MSKRHTSRQKLRVITIIYWFLLAYVLAALVWWFIALERQNQAMAAMRLSNIAPTDVQAPQKQAQVLEFARRKSGQYIGEGIIFMLLIMVGAVFVYRATRRYLRLGQQQQNFMMAVTHELKTPISVARLNVETLARRQLQPEQQQRLLQQTLAETDRLNDLCNNILLAARLDAGQVQFVKEPLLLNQLAAQLVKQYQERFDGRSIEWVETQEVTIMGEPMLLRMLLSNLLDNALKYAPPPTPVQVGVGIKHGRPALWVADEGPGIPEAERQRIFQKFYRLGAEETRSARGTGLGLYLVKKIANDHGAEVGV